VLAGLDRHEVRFDWQATPGERYNVQIARDPAFEHIMTDKMVAAGKLSWKRPWPGRYYIRLQPVSPQGTNPPGKPEAFDVPIPLWVGLALPAALLAGLLL
jgi:hypothetical protein